MVFLAVTQFRLFYLYGLFYFLVMKKKSVSIKDALLGSNNELTYSEKLKHPKWQKKRLEIMNRDNWKCVLCNDTETTLNVHHLSYHDNPWDVDNNELITLCEDCHAFIEENKSEISTAFSDYKMAKFINKDSKLNILVDDGKVYFSSKTLDKKILFSFSIGLMSLKDAIQ